MVAGRRRAKRSLERSPFERRALKSLLLTIGAWAAAIVAAIPLVSVLYMLIVRGRLAPERELFVELPPAGFEMGGGFGNAIVGTIVDDRHRRAFQHSPRRARRRLPGRAGPGQPARPGRALRHQDAHRACRPSSPASSPTRWSSCRPAPTPPRRAGSRSPCSCCRRWSSPPRRPSRRCRRSPATPPTAWAARGARSSGRCCCRPAMPGILTGVMLAVARAAGETAPLLFTALFSSYWLFDGGQPRLMQPTASLAVLIYNFSGMPFENQIELAWAASLVLVLMVLIINVLSRLVGSAAGVNTRERLDDSDDATRTERRANGRAEVERRRDRLQARPGLLRQLPRRPGQPRADREGEDHRLHRSVRLRQEHGAALAQPHERPDPGLPLRGPRPLPRQGRLRRERRSGRGAPLHRHGLPAAQPVLDEHLRQRGLRPPAQPLQGHDRRAGRAGPAAGGPVGRGQGQAEEQRPVALRRPAAAALHRPRRRHRARRAPDGRAVLRARSRSPPGASRS